MGFLDSIFGGASGAEGDLADIAGAGFNENILQHMLPRGLRRETTEPIIKAGIAGLGDLIRNPGGLNPNIADAIRPRLAATSEGIAQNFRGIRENQAGSFARSNAPMSIRSALDSALNVSQERAQRGARREALTDSEQLRRADLNQTFAILDSILQFLSSSRGQAISGLGASAGLAANRQGSQMAFLGSLLGTGGSLLTGSGVFGGNTPAAEPELPS